MKTKSVPQWRIRLAAWCARVLLPSADDPDWSSCSNIERLHVCANILGDAETAEGWSNSPCHYRLVEVLRGRADWLHSFACQLEADENPRGR